MTDLERIEAKLDEVLALLGNGKARTTSELRRKASADIIRLTARSGKRIKGHGCENDTHEKARR